MFYKFVYKTCLLRVRLLQWKETYKERAKSGVSTNIILYIVTCKVRTQDTGNSDVLTVTSRVLYLHLDLIFTLYDLNMIFHFHLPSYRSNDNFTWKYRNCCWSKPIYLNSIVNIWYSFPILLFFFSSLAEWYRLLSSLAFASSPAANLSIQAIMVFMPCWNWSFEMAKPQVVDQIDDLVSQGHYRNRSHAVEEGLKRLIVEQESW